MASLRRRVVEQRRRRDQALLERELVDEGLERRARLAPREHAVDLARRRTERRVEPTQASTSPLALSSTTHGAVLDVAAGELGELAAQRLDREALQARRRACPRCAAGAAPGRCARRAKCGASCSPSGIAAAPRQGGLGQRRRRRRSRAAAAGARRRRARATAAAGRSGARTSAAATAASCAVEAARALGEQGLGERVDADDLAAERHRVEIGLEDLALLPRRLEPGRGHRLAELLRRRCARPPGAPGRRRAGRRAASSGSRRRACGCSIRLPQALRAARAPVDAAVLPEAPVLAQDDRRQQGRRHLGERHPGEAAHRPCRRAGSGSARRGGRAG